MFKFVLLLEDKEGVNNSAVIMANSLYSAMQNASILVDSLNKDVPERYTLEGVVTVSAMEKLGLHLVFDRSELSTGDNT